MEQLLQFRHEPDGGPQPAFPPRRRVLGDGVRLPAHGLLQRRLLLQDQYQEDSGALLGKTAVMIGAASSLPV